MLRCQLLRQHALHPNLPPRAARGAGPRRADRIHLSTSLTTNQTVCTDLTCHLPNTSRAFSGCSPVHLQATGPYIQAAALSTQVRASCKPRASLACLPHPASECASEWEKSPQPTRDGHQRLTLSRCEGCAHGVFRPQVYSGTKFAVEAMGAALRLELAPFGISVSSINPAFVRTEILNYAKKDDYQPPKDPDQVASCKSTVCIVRYGGGSPYFAYLLTAIRASPGREGDGEAGGRDCQSRHAGGGLPSLLFSSASSYPRYHGSLFGRLNALLLTYCPRRSRWTRSCTRLRAATHRCV